MQKTEVFLDDFFENAPDGFVSVDATSKQICMVNSTAVKRLGYDAKNQLIGQDLLFIYDRSCHALVDDLYGKFLKDGKVSSNQIFLKHRDGYPVRVTLNVSGVYDNNGELQYSRSIFREYDLEKRDTLVSTNSDWIATLDEGAKERLVQKLNGFRITCDEMLDQMPSENTVFAESNIRLIFDIDSALRSLDSAS